MEHNNFHKYIHDTIQKDICPNRSCNYFTEEEFKDNHNKNNYDLSLDLHFNEHISMINCKEFDNSIIELTKIGKNYFNSK